MPELFAAARSASSSACAVGSARSFLAGKFVHPAFEKAFRVPDLEPLERVSSFGVGLAWLILPDFAAHDALVLPEVRCRACAVRFGVLVPALVAGSVLNSVHLRSARRSI